jgi:hypothetical protein
MKTRILRFLLPAILVVAGTGGVAWTWALAQHVDQLETTGRQSAARIDRLEALLDEFTHDELIYVASGQVDGETLNNTSNRLRQIESESSWLLGPLLAAAAPSARAIANGVASLAKVDASARENMRAGLDLMAADLLFTGTTPIREGMREQLRTLRRVESSAVADARSNDLKQAWIALAVVALLFAWALVRSSRRPVATVPNEIRVDPPEPDHVPLNEVQQPTGHAARDTAAVAPAVDLRETAALCTAISRLQVETDLEALLVRTARLLGASGIVVWMTAGEEMFPVAWHGYDSRQLSQLGSIGASSMNATAAAWRSGTLQTVSGDSTSRSAIVAPLLGVERCIGVLAIEVTPGQELDVTMQAVTTLIAAQLVTVLGAWPAGSSVAPTDVLQFERVSASS